MVQLDSYQIGPGEMPDMAPTQVACTPTAAIRNASLYRASLYIGILSVHLQVWHATVIPSRITPFSSDHGRQTGLGQISTTLGDHAGISGAVAFCFRLLL